MNVQKRPSVTNEFGEEIFHDGRASFDIRPFLPYLQSVIDVWNVGEDTGEAIIDSILNPAPAVHEADHWITLAELLIRWNYEPEAVEALEHVPSSHERYEYALEQMRLAHERMGNTADVERVQRQLEGLAGGEEEEEGELVYNMDVFASALVGATMRAVRSASLYERPLWGLKLVVRDTGGIVPEEVWLSWAQGGDFEDKLPIDAPATRIPRHVDDVGEARRHEEPSLALIDELKITDDTLDWDDRFGLLRQLLYYELKRALQSVADTLGDEGVQFGEGCKLAVGDPEDNFVSVKVGEPLKLGALQKKLKVLGKSSRHMLEAVAELCFADADRQHWLIETAQQK